MDEIEKIIPVKLPIGTSISIGKQIARFKRNVCGISKDLLGPAQPERLNPENHSGEITGMICDSLTTAHNENV